MADRISLLTLFAIAIGIAFAIENVLRSSVFDPDTDCDSESDSRTA